jgi:TatD DNase family protein
MFIDTHAHLYSESFDEDRDTMIQRAMDQGVKTFLLPNVDLASIEGMYDLEKKYPANCFPMMGLHPCSVKEDYEEVLAKIKQELNERNFIGIGEIGIDLYWDKSFLQQQQDAFATQIEWALERDLPIVIHARDSFSEIFEVIDSYQNKGLKGIFHCFTGGLEEVEKIRSYQHFLFGIGGVATFKKSGLDVVIRELNLHEMVLETDAPYLAPSPHRGKRNESSYIPLIADKISDFKEISIQEVAKATTLNAKKLFNVDFNKQKLPLNQQQG